jgi:phage terminase large subunit-like protein
MTKGIGIPTYIEVEERKSELAAGVALYCLIADDEPGAEVYSAAASKDQAALVYKVAASMVDKSPILSKRLRVLRSTKIIIKRKEPESLYREISSDDDLQDGINPHCVIADELHRWKVGKALDLWEILERGTIARRQPLMLTITTAGVQDESPLCWRLHECETSPTGSLRTRTSTAGSSSATYR